ncbi:hypothetical protein AAMO2058_000251300 [Amorphochlora amoebiformis]
MASHGNPLGSPLLGLVCVFGGGIVIRTLAQIFKSPKLKQLSKPDVVDKTKDKLLRLTFSPLESEDLIQQCGDPSCGAISTFVGTTRNSFQGKAVTKLVYDAYDSMCIKKLNEICDEMRSKWNVKKIVIHHRLGICPVGEASVLIAVSSPHRKASLEATQWCINTLKERVPIWKREHYLDGSIWKENKEFDAKNLTKAKNQSN